MIPHWLVDARTLRVLSRFSVGAAMVTGLGVLLCLGRIYMAASQTRTSQAALQSAKAELAETDAQIKRALAVKKSKSPNSKQIVDSFQSTTYGLAAKHGATVSELTVNTDVQAYLSKFTNELQGGGWSQIAVRFTLRGASQDVIRTLASLRTTDIPFEMDTLEINRSGWDSSGTAEVTAQVQLRLLMRA